MSVKKTQSPIVTTLLGNDTSFRALHPAKAELPIVVMPSDTVTEITSLCIKLFSPTEVTW